MRTAIEQALHYEVNCHSKPEGVAGAMLSLLSWITYVLCMSQRKHACNRKPILGFRRSTFFYASALS